MRWGLWTAGALAPLALSVAATAHDPVPPKTKQIGTALIATPGAGDRPQQPPGQTLPMKPARTLRFSTSSGTWMSLDVAPDGRTLVFDLLGDLYAMPTSGGSARRLSQGLAFDSQPTYSPDGRSIAFVSDRSGADNIWIAKADGSAPRQLSFGDDDTILASPAWSSDGRSIFVSRYRSSLNNYELWRYGLDGGTSMVAPIRDDPGQSRDSWRSTLGAASSPDGKSVYFARRSGSLNFDEVDSWTIARRDLATGKESDIVAEADARRSEAKGSYFRPALSPDGRLLAYASRVRNRTDLRLRDLATGLDRRIAFPIEHDQLQASMWQDIVPRYDFTPDGKSLIVSRNGGFERVDIASGTATALPFRADVRLAVGPSTRVDIREEKGPVRARLIQSPVASPDGKRLAFSALARLYLAELRTGAAPVRISTGGEPAFQPSWSPDGSQLAFITWSEKNGGLVWTIPVDGSSAPVRRVQISAFYSYPVFSPDGRHLIVVRSAHAARLATSFEYGKLRDAQLIEIPLAGGEPRVLAEGTIGSRAHFRSEKPNAVVLMSNEGLIEIDRATGARTPLVQVQGPGWYFQEDPVPVDDARLSPDGRWILAQVAGQLHLVAAPAAGSKLDLLAPGLPHRRVTSVGADFFEWSADGKEIHWSVGSTFYRRPLSSVALNPPDKPGWRAAPPLGSAFPMAVEVPRAAAPGSVLFRGARILTMADGDKVIEDADLLVTGGRIARLGRRGSFSVPADAELIDVAGKTIVPGFIDTHDHIGGVRREVLSLDDWGLQARLAFGVTTSFDPSTLSIDMLAYQDLLDAGMMVGPRIRQTAPAIFSMNKFESLDEVRAVLRRYRDHYRLRNIKQYRTGDRQVRQWMAMAARELGMHPTVEGALSMKLDLMQIIDGFAGHEHALPASLHDDVITLLKETRTSYTTTLQITNSGFPAQDWFIISDKPAADARVRRFWPQWMIDSKLTTAISRPLEEYRFPETAADAGRVQRAGGLLGMGAHGDHPGIGYHYELGAHLLGGMTPVEILHAATIGSAETIGRASDLGSLEQGKVADLLVLRRDPRTDIKAAREIDLIMKEGVLFDGATLDQLRPVRAPLSPWWRRGEAAPAQWLPEAR